MVGQQYSRKKLFHLLHLEAESAILEEEGGICECQFSAARRCGNTLYSCHDLSIFVLRRVLLNQQC